MKAVIKVWEIQRDKVHISYVHFMFRIFCDASFVTYEYVHTCMLMDISFYDKHLIPEFQWFSAWP